MVSVFCSTQTDLLCYRLCRRFKFLSPEKLNSKILCRLHVLFGNLEAAPFRCIIESCEETKSYQIQFVKMEEKHRKQPYALVVVDEAHHLYRDPHCRKLIETYADHPSTHRMLLSDVSQSHGRKIDWPKDTHVVRLTEVVRCSQRIIAGAMAFQLDGVDGKTKKQDTMSQHKATGPPLKTVLFDVPPGADRVEQYVERTLDGVRYVVKEYPGLILHNRMAILTPDEEMKDVLTDQLEEPLNKIDKDRKFKIISSKEAASTVYSDNYDGVECVVVDTVASFDGLERLIILGVDLDVIMHDPSVDTHESRSMLYRALTRAHMFAMLINELLRGGWLEFLMGIKLDQQTEEKFDLQDEKGRQDHEAAKRMLDVALQEALDTQTFLNSHSRQKVQKIIKTQQNLQAITAEDMEEVVNNEASAWHQAELAVAPSVVDEAERLGFELNEETKMSVIADTVARSRDAEVTLQGARDDSSTVAVQWALFRLIPNELKAAACKRDIPMSDDLLKRKPEFQSMVAEQLGAEGSGIQAAVDLVMQSWADALKFTDEILLEVAADKGVSDSVTESTSVVGAKVIAALDIFNLPRDNEELVQTELVRENLLKVLWKSHVTQEVNCWLGSQDSLAASDEKLVFEYVMATVHDWATEGVPLPIQQAFASWLEWDRSLNAALEQAVKNSDTELPLNFEKALLKPTLRTKLPIQLDGTAKQASEIDEIALAVLEAHTNPQNGIQQEQLLQVQEEVEWIQQERKLEHLSQQEMDHTIAEVMEAVKAHGISIEEAAKHVMPMSSNVWSVDCESAE